MLIIKIKDEMLVNFVNVIIMHLIFMENSLKIRLSLIFNRFIQ